jgi:hypothetical protein
LQQVFCRTKAEPLCLFERKREIALAAETIYYQSISSSWLEFLKTLLDGGEQVGAEAVDVEIVNHRSSALEGPVPCPCAEGAVGHQSAMKLLFVLATDTPDNQSMRHVYRHVVLSDLDKCFLHHTIGGKGKTERSIALKHQGIETFYVCHGHNTIRH